MKKRKITNLFSMVLASSMAMSSVTPAMIFAQEQEEQPAENLEMKEETLEETEEENSEVIEEVEETENQEVSQDEEDSEEVETEEEAEEKEGADTFESFMNRLQELEEYAKEYDLNNQAKVMINYIRTGVEKYTSSSWAILAGAEDTAFKAFVEEKDEENGTNAQALKNLVDYTLPNGQEVEFTHMFGALNVASYNDYKDTNVDFGSWAGDLVDLAEYSNGKVSGDVDAMADAIRTTLLGIDDPDHHSFGQKDIYGDLDAFAIVQSLKQGNVSLANIFDSYFSSSLTDQDRAAFFINKRFPGKTTKEAVREAVYEAYKGNSGVIMLEADRGLTSKKDLTKATAYAFADYLFALADGKLIEVTPEDPTPDTPEEPEKDNDYYTVFNTTSETICPGVTHTEKMATTADDKQVVFHIGKIDVSRDDIQICANYKDNDGSSWGMARVTDQMASAEANHKDVPNYKAVLGINADYFNMTTGAPSGALVMEGKIYHEGSDSFFGILKDGTPIIGRRGDWAKYRDQLQEAVGGDSCIVLNGEIATGGGTNYYNSRAPRTCVGITASGEVVFLTVDGRQEPYSCGAAYIEMAQMMVDAGCEIAFALDGGGSTTMAAKREGEDRVSVVNKPSDGFQRSVSSSLMVVTTSKVSNEFDHAVINTEADYITRNTQMKVNLVGVSQSGNTAEIPEGAKLRVSDETIGTIEDDVFTAKKRGKVNIELVLDDKVVASKEVNVVTPNGIQFTKDKIIAIFGSEVPLPIEVTYNGNPVKVSESDVSFTLSSPNAGTIDNFKFIGNEESQLKMVTVTADLSVGISEPTTCNIALYGDGEAIFDFDKAENGDGSLAWNRDVSNSTSSDKRVYYVNDPTKEMEASYVFALDIREIEIPEQLTDLVKLLPGGDSADASAWKFLLQLAERVSVLTEVNIVIDVDPNLDVDISNINFANEYFQITSSKFDKESHKISIVLNWIDQSQAIDPDTANPICVISGIKMKPKEDANWKDNVLNIKNTGKVSYDIYLRAGTLYGVASDPAIQEAYGVYPFINPNDPGERGGHFGTDYKTFVDEFVLNNSMRQGWVMEDDIAYYYVDNKPVTGVQELPGYNDENNKYFYKFDENGACQFKINGIFEYEGNTYFAKQGVAQTGWQTLDGKDYLYLNPETRAAINGEQKIDGYNYRFDDYILARGDVVKNDKGYRYMWAGEWSTQQWINVDGAISYTTQSGYFATGIPKLYSPEGVVYQYILGDDGVWKQETNGIYEYEGVSYLAEDGYIVQYPGLVKIGDDYYYFKSDNTMIKDRDYWVSKTNDLLPEKSYTFDKDGKIVLADAPVIPEKKNGIVAENGSLFYYVNDKLTYAGLIEIDGDYYYVKTSGEVIHGRDYWISKTNGLMKEGSYTFDEDGKLILPDAPVIPEKKNGIVAENGSLYYYVNDVITYAGLIEIDGNYYYVKTSGEVVHGRDYWISKTNGLLPEKSYTFDKDGKIILPVTPEQPDVPVEPEKKNGIVAENGSLYYYVNDELTYAGLIEIDGDYYYVKTSGEVIHGRNYWVTKHNGLLPEGSYTFDDSGKLVNTVVPTMKNGIIAEDGTLYYYVNNVKTYAGLIEIDGNYYYVKTSGEVIHGRDYWISKTNGLLPEKSYTFDESGHLVQ